MNRQQHEEAVGKFHGAQPAPETSTETKYMWKEFATVEGEDTPRLLTPWADPMKYEMSFDFIWDTPKEALEGLKSWEDAYAEAQTEGWILVRVETTPVGSLLEVMADVE